MSSPGESLRRLRVERGLEIDDVARTTGLEPTRIEDLEAGLAHAWFQEALVLANAYGMVIDDFARVVYGWERPDGSMSLEEPFGSPRSLPR